MLLKLLIFFSTGNSKRFVNLRLEVELSFVIFTLDFGYQLFFNKCSIIRMMATYVEQYVNPCLAYNAFLRKHAEYMHTGKSKVIF